MTNSKLTILPLLLAASALPACADQSERGGPAWRAVGAAPSIRLDCCALPPPERRAACEGLSRRHLAPRLPTDLPNRPFESAILPAGDSRVGRTRAAALDRRRRQ